MKKVLVSLLCVISILLSCAFAFNKKVTDNNNMINFDNNENSMQFHIQSSNGNKEDILKGFKQLSNKYKISIIKTDYIMKNNKQLVQKAGIFRSDYFKTADIDLYSGTYPTNKNQCIASFKTGRKQQVGTIRDLFGDQKMIVESMDTAFSNHGLTVNGQYTIQFKDINNKKTVNAVKAGISNITGLSQASLFNNMGGSVTNIGTTYLITLILIVFVVAIFSLTNIFYPITKLKEIGVMKLLGHSNHKIWTELNMHIVIIPVVFTALTIVIQAFLIEQATIAYFVELCIYQLLITLGGIAISLIMLLIIKRLKIGQILKKSFNFKISLYSSYILKFLVFVGLVFAIPSMVKEVQRYISERSMTAMYQEQSDYVTLANFAFTGNEMNAYMGNGGDQLSAKFIAMFKELEHTADAEYVTTLGIQPNALESKDSDANAGASKDDEYVLSIVNENYLKRIKYHFDKPLDDYFSKDLTILIPMKYKNKNMEELVKNQIVPIYFPTFVDKQSKWNQLPISIQYYNDNNKAIFSEDLDRANMDHGYIRDPIFVCQSAKYVTTKNSLIMNSAISNPIRIFNSSKNRNAIHRAIVDNGLENNNLVFANMLDSGFAQQVSISQSSSLVWSGIMVLALLVSILASYYISIIILVSKRQRMLVSRLLGHSFFMRFKNEICYFMSIYVFAFVELLFLSRNIVSILFFAILVLIDMLIVYSLVRRHDRKSLNTALKGEE